MSTPRIAVVGGGIAGTLCSLVLKNRGLRPILLDAGGGGVGGRLRGGAPVWRATDVRLIPVMQMLQAHNIVHVWNGRFGLLGSQNGGFLPSKVVTAGISSSSSLGNSNSPIMGLSQADDSSSSSSSSDNNDNKQPAATDQGDFCQFVQSDTTPTFVGHSSMADVCPQIVNLARIDHRSGVKVEGGTMAEGGGWNLNILNDQEEHFDGVVLATHDPTLAASFVQTIVDAEIQAGGYNLKNGEASADPAMALLQRLSKLAPHLQQVRRQPLFTVQVRFSPETSKALPFDAVSVPGSSVVQFLTRSSVDDDVWTAITTSQFARQVLDEHGTQDDHKAHVTTVVTDEIQKLWQAYVPNATPMDTTVKRWGSALCQQGLDLKEDSILLSAWRLAICGDFIRDPTAYPTPLEATSLSGLEAGERITSLFVDGGN